MAKTKNIAPPPLVQLTREQTGTLWRFRAALERICDHNDPAQDAAWSMAYTAIDALITKHPDSLAGAVRWRAWVMGASGPDSPDLAMINIAHHVRIASDLFEGCATEGVIDENVPFHFRDALIGYVKGYHPRGLPKGCSVPSAEELRDWLLRHGKKRTRGRKLTTQTIVAKIMVRCELLGAEPPKTNLPADVEKAERKQFDRVRNALKNHPHW